MTITWDRYLWSEKWEDIRKKYEDEGIPFTGPAFEDIEIEEDVEDDDEITLDVEHLVTPALKETGFLFLS